MKLPLIIHHGNCVDGYTAAHIMRKWYRKNGIEPDLHAGVYNTPLPDVDDRQVAVVDFSYTLPVMEELIARCDSLIWLDHHATAIKECGHLLVNPKVQGRLTTERSGAWLAWVWANGEDAVPRMIDLVDDRDRWVLRLPDSRAFAAGLFSRNYSEHEWEAALCNPETVITDGHAVDKYLAKTIDELITATWQTRLIADYAVPVVNLPYTMASEGGAMLLERFPEAPFAAAWYLRNDGKYVYSLRSRAGEFDVGALAKSLGGGGHPAASGFAVSERIDK